ncbi:MAG: PAS domain S-box protein [bacterium]|jgi:PAS domain S-box-containing protein|nr:PAS domain S-box protein [bacterium]
MSHLPVPSYEELQRRLASATAALEAIRTGQIDTIMGKDQPLVIRLAVSEEQQAHIKRVLLAIRNVNQLIVKEENPSRLIRQACEILIETLGYYNAWIALFDENQKVTEVASAGFEKDFACLAELFHEGEYPFCVRQAMTQDGIRIVEDPAEQCRDCPLSKEYAGRSGLAARLAFGGTVLGFLSVSVPRDYAQNEEEQALFAELAGDLGYALHKLALAEQSRLHEMRYQTLFKDALNPIWIVDQEGRYLDANPAALDFLECTREELLTKCVWDFTPPHLVSQQKQEHFPFQRPRTIETAYWVKGGIKTLLLNIVPWEMKGQKVLCGIGQDITEHKRAEETLRQEHARLQFFIEGGRAGTWEWNCQTGETVFNHTWAKILGYTLEELAPFTYQTWERLVHPDDVSRANALLAECVQGLQPDYECEFRMKHKEGHWIWILDRGRLLQWDSEGRPLKLFGTHTNITERKQTEESIRTREQFLQTILQTTVDGFFVLNGEGIVTEINLAFSEMLGYPKQDLIGQFIGDLDADESPADTAARMRRIMQNGSELFEVRMHRKDGSILHAEVSTTYLDLVGGQFVCFCRDLTQRKKAEETLREREHFLHTILHSMMDGFFVLDKTGHVKEANPAYCQMLGYAAAEMVGLGIGDLDAVESPAETAARVTHIRETGAERFETWHRRKDGQAIPVEISTTFLDKTSGEMICFCRDLTQKKEDEARLATMAEMLDTAPSSITVHDTSGQFLYANLKTFALHGYKPQEFMAINLHDLDVPESASLLEKRFQQIMVHGEASFEVAHYRKDGSTIPLHVQTKLIDWYGQPAILSIGGDITERKEAEEALRHSRDMMRYVIEHVRSAVAVHDREMRYIYVSQRYMQEYKVPDADIIGKGHYDVFPDLPQKWRDVHQRALAGEVCSAEDDVYLRDDGSEEWTRWECRPWYESDGSIGGVIVYTEIITDKIRAEQEKDKLRRDLAQAQKMESVGRLAGGVAHDFNNMLNVILGYSDLLLLETTLKPSLHQPLEEIRKAAQRSADLTRQLLAFARKQTVSPKVLNLNETIEVTLKMLRRLIGEDIDLHWSPSPTIEPVRIDPTQIDQILTNLAVNARDAIGTTMGRITIETRLMDIDEMFCVSHPHFVVGRYMMLAVSDTGCGMNEETKAHLFEPFFTTKGVGKGTGLGLATVYGIVKQNHGFVQVYSEPGHGTSIQIYFPILQAELRPEDGKKEAVVERGQETILLVEDEPAILALGETMLKRLGYRVLAAATPGEAMRLAEEYAGEIHLLITDVVMPEKNGRDLARAILDLYPQMKCLFMSGYTANVIAHHGVLDAGVQFIQKPFSMQALGKKVRETILGSGG